MLQAARRTDSDGKTKISEQCLSPWEKIKIKKMKNFDRVFEVDHQRRLSCQKNQSWQYMWTVLEEKWIKYGFQEILQV